MCVIILAETGRPTSIMLTQAWEPNDDGAGIAWRESVKLKAGKKLEVSSDPNAKPEMEVVWKKGLNLEQVKELAAKVPLPFVVHFRSASQGGVWPELTHPFEVTEATTLRLSGRTKNPVLFHNGTWGQWADKSAEAAIRSGVNVPLGLWSDSRAMAWLSSPGICGHGFVSFLTEQRGVLFGVDYMNVFRGPGWVEVKDGDNTFWCSNDRPWKPVPGNSYAHGGHNNHGHDYQSRVCAWQQCKRRDGLDQNRRCPDHPMNPPKVEDKSSSLALVPAGGAPAPTPFPHQTPLRVITLEEIEALQKADRISKNFLKAVTTIYDRLTNPKLSEGQRRKALESLELVTLSLTSSGHLASTQKAG